MGCTGLTSIEIPNGVAEIGSSAFGGCTGLTSIEVPNGITTIGDSVFDGCTGLTSIEIPNSVAEIGYHAFMGCTGLTSIEIPNSVTAIGHSAFMGCTGLKEITIPFVGNGIGITHFGFIFGASKYDDQKSYVPSSLEKVTITGGAMIDRYAFYDCTGLTNIILGDSVKNIDRYAFSDCSNLTTIYYTGTPTDWTSITIDSFNNPITSATIYYYSETQPTDTTVQYWHYVDGVPTVWIPYVGTDASYFKFTELSDGTYSIAAKDINNMPATVVLPENYNGKAVTQIAGGGFRNCTRLTSITIPRSINCIGSGAFSGCNNLEGVTFKNTYGWSLSNGTSISSSAISPNIQQAARLLNYFYSNHTWSRG
jgi:hypothetical protein